MSSRLSTRARLLLIVSCGVIVLSSVGACGLVYLHLVKSDWGDFVRVVHSKQHQLMEIRSLMGYGSGIHNFKNYVLRGDEEYFDAALENAREAIEAIEAYRLVGKLSSVERDSLDMVQRMVIAYREAALTTRDLRAAGKTTLEIDPLVRIDDAPYVQAIASLSSELARATEASSDLLSGRARQATILLTIAVLTAGALFFSVSLSVTRSIEATTRALEESQTLRDRFVERTLTAQEDERRRIARELHDEAGQALSSMVVGLQQIREASELERAHARAESLQSVAEGVIDELDRMARGLHPRLLEDLGFVDAVEHLAAEVTRIHRIEVDVQLVGLDDDELPLPIATALYRVIQEALTNVVKHAQARTANIVVNRDASYIRAIVEDDGHGFDARIQSRGMGLLGIRERVKLLGGTVDVESIPDQGTMVALRIPLPRAGR